MMQKTNLILYTLLNDLVHQSGFMTGSGLQVCQLFSMLSKIKTNILENIMLSNSDGKGR